MKLRNHVSDSIGQIVVLPGVETRLTAEYAIRAAIDSQVFPALRELESLDGGRAVQAVYIALIRRLPNVLPDRRRLAIDSGFSESSVKRAIALLEAIGLTKVKRMKGRSSVYHLADLRLSDVATECLCRIRRIARVKVASKPGASRVNSEPSCDLSRVTSEPGGRVTCGCEVGSEVTQKETKKISNKQQCAAAFGRGKGTALEGVLTKWGLGSAAYIATPGHRQAIRVLVDNPGRAAVLIEKTMRGGAWSNGAGVGARVSFLRENVERVAASLDAGSRQKAHIWKSTSSNVVEDEARDAEREKVEREVMEMPQAEFVSSCERLFSANPGLRFLYRDLPRDSRGLNVSLASFLANERKAVAMQCQK